MSTQLPRSENARLWKEGVSSNREDPTRSRSSWINERRPIGPFVPLKAPHLAMIALALFCIAQALSASTPFEKSEYAVVVHPENEVEELTLRELTSIFKATKQSWSWKDRIYLILPKSSTPEFSFLLESVYEQTDVELARYWIELQYRNKISARPKSLARGPLTINVVQRRAGALALVRVADLPAKGVVKILTIEGLKPGQEGYALYSSLPEVEGEQAALPRSTREAISASAPRDGDRDERDQRLEALEEIVAELLVGDSPEEEDDDGSPSLSLRGFGHVQFSLDEMGSRSNNRFALGGLDLLIQSQLSDHVSFLNETVFEPTDTGEYVLDVERVILKYDFGDYLNVQAGRFHTNIGYWNEVYHHGEWLQTAIGRPRIFDFEDENGLLPVHMTGLSLQGRIEGEDGSVEYKVEVGNGRGSMPDPPQNTVDVNDSKALNLALAFSPEGAGGLQFGGSAYFDRIPKELGAHADMREQIFAVFATYIENSWELLGEFVHIAHQENGGPKTETSGYYAQIARRCGKFTPFLRVGGVDIDDMNTFFASTDDERRFIAGVRWEVGPWTALKLQYERIEEELAAGGDLNTDGAKLQLSFTF